MQPLNSITKWLLSVEPWVEYRTRIDLLDQPESEPDVQIARKKMLDHPQVKALIEEVKVWPGEVLKRHNDAKHSIHKLSFLAELGLTKSDPGIEETCDRIFRNQSSEGVFEVIGNIPTHFGGSGRDEFLWMLCDAPLVVYSLVRFGYGNTPEVQKAILYLIQLNEDNGWHCCSSESLGQKFRGPGRKDDPCPYANLIMLKLISELPEIKTSAEADSGLHCIFHLWGIRKEKKPYLFGMGTDFRKLKAPFIWYDILHVLDILSKFPSAHDHIVTNELMSILTDKQDESGKFTPESVFRAWKDWDFGQKKEPSAWLTLMVYRILKKIEKI
jgi:hypothetical protein